MTTDHDVPGADDGGLREFLAPASPLAGTGTDRAARRIVSDLVASPARLSAAYLLTHACGYAVSLAVCAQNGVGILPLSHSVASSMHVIPWPWCPLVCGALFALVPNLFARLFLTRFQQRYLFWKLGWLLALAPLAAAFGLALLGERDPGEFLHGVTHGDLSSGAWMLLWTLGALGTSAMLEGAFAALLFRASRSRPERRTWPTVPRFPLG